MVLLLVDIVWAGMGPMI